jgi:hypothetical protein
VIDWESGRFVTYADIIRNKAVSVENELAKIALKQR